MPWLAAPMEKMPVDEATLFGVPVIMWLIGLAFVFWLWGEWDIRRRRKCEEDMDEDMDEDRGEVRGDD